MSTNTRKDLALDPARLRAALEEVLIPMTFHQQQRIPRARSSSSETASSTLDGEEVFSLIDFFVEDVIQSGLVILPGPENGRTLDEVESTPLHSVLAPRLPELLFSLFHDEGEKPGASEVHGTGWKVTTCISDILDAYDRDIVDSDDAISHTKLPDDCELCARPMSLTRHHLIPRSEHAILIKRKLFTRKECEGRIAYLCRPCHSAVHGIFSNGELAREFNTISKLEENEVVERWVKWISKQRVVRKGLKIAR